jgi:hypothetical protein
MVPSRCVPATVTVTPNPLPSTVLHLSHLHVMSMCETVTHPADLAHWFHPCTWFGGASPTPLHRSGRAYSHRPPPLAYYPIIMSFAPCAHTVHRRYGPTVQTLAMLASSALVGLVGNVVSLTSSGWSGRRGASVPTTTVGGGSASESSQSRFKFGFRPPSRTTVLRLPLGRGLCTCTPPAPDAEGDGDLDSESELSLPGTVVSF